MKLIPFIAVLLLTACQSAPPAISLPPPTEADLADTISVLQFANGGPCEALDETMSGLADSSCEQRKQQVSELCGDLARKPVSVLHDKADPSALIIARYTFCYTSLMKSQTFDVEQFDRWFVNSLMEQRAKNGKGE
ncbi:hypothetical protein OCL06_04235 [Alteromonas sp. ASW11-19]|uniref:Lipoprotein n=1 Tax=Alteromonas salexigens TaxID=2982530 RepID=A0ABT2VKI6_9ALTE|nr:hypothetical protein [Alteromonas salexigens]MCU7553805.1 hypothetical protein [Alteromonas salexigens]